MVRMPGTVWAKPLGRKPVCPEPAVDTARMTRGAADAAGGRHPPVAATPSGLAGAPPARRPVVAPPARRARARAAGRAPGRWRAARAPRRPSRRLAVGARGSTSRRTVCCSPASTLSVSPAGSTRVRTRGDLAVPAADLGERDLLVAQLVDQGPRQPAAVAIVDRQRDPRRPARAAAGAGAEEPHHDHREEQHPEEGAAVLDRQTHVVARTAAQTRRHGARAGAQARLPPQHLALQQKRPGRQQHQAEAAEDRHRPQDVGQAAAGEQVPEALRPPVERRQRRDGRGPPAGMLSSGRKLPPENASVR